MTAAPPAEVSELHTQLLRVSLEPELARAYWGHADPTRPSDQEAELAFSEHWFGAKSMARVRALSKAFHAHFAAFPGALEALHGWTSADRTLHR